MILIDWNNIVTMRYSVVQREVFKNEKNIFKRTGKIELTDKHFRDLRTGFMNLIIKDLIRFQMQHGARYGDIVIAADYKKSNYWRKTIHPRYKESRDINKKNAFDTEIGKNMKQDKNDLAEIIKLLGYIILDDIQHPETKETVEADDIIGCLTRIPGKHLIVSSDGDFDQLLINSNIKRHDLMSSKMVTKSRKEIQEKNYKALILGQSKDDIPNVKFEAELSDDFIEWMKKTHNIEITKDMIFTIKEKYSKYTEEYKLEKYKEETILIAEGKRKQRRNLTAFQKPNFGEVAFNKMMANIGIDNFLTENTIYKDNYELNKHLYLLENIPKRIIEIIGRNYLDKKRNVSSNRYEVEKLFYANSIDVLLLHEFF